MDDEQRRLWKAACIATLNTMRLMRRRRRCIPATPSMATLTLLLTLRLRWILRVFFLIFSI